MIFCTAARVDPPQRATTEKEFQIFASLANPLACYRSLSGPSGPKCPPECPRQCPRECPRKWRVSEGMSDGVSRGPSGPGLRSVQKVSRECPRSVKKLSRTLRGHSWDTFWTLWSQGPASGPGDTPSVGH